MLQFMTNWIKICLLILMITMKSCQKFYKTLKIYICRTKNKKFNKRKHRKEGWMTIELLAKVVRKNELYVNWKTTSLLHENYETIKTEFKNCKKGVLRDIANAKKIYYNRIFNSSKRGIKKRGELLMKR